MRVFSKHIIVAYITFTVVILFMLFSQLEIGAIAAGNAGWDEAGKGSASGGGISGNAGESGWPSIAIADGNPYVAWYDNTSGDKEIYVRRWNGTAWNELGANSASGGGISNNSSISTAPSIAVGADGKPCVAWRDLSSGYFEIYLRCWNGTNWIELGTNSATGGGVSNQQGFSPQGPSLAYAPDGKLYVAWDNEGPNSNEIYVSRWNGATWERLPAGGNVSNTSNDSWRPNLAIAPNGTPFIAWQQDGDPDSEIYIRRWDGSSWVEVGTGSASGGGISHNSGKSGTVSLEISNDGTPYVAWRDDSSGNFEIYVRQWNGSSWVEVGANSATGGGISNDAGTSTKPSLAISAGKGPCVVWQSGNNSPNEIFVRCWYGAFWAEVDAGSASGSGISSNNGQSSSPLLTIGSDRRAYSTWGDSSSGNYEIYVRGRQLPIEPPPTATNTPLATATPTATPSLTYTPTNTPIPGTSTPTSTPRPKAHIPIILYQLPPTTTPTITPTPSPTPTRRPIFLGLNARWDGRGFIRTDEYYEPGTHLTMVFTEMIDGDIARAEMRHWYDPNPRGWESEEWFEFYSTKTGEYKSSSQPGDPAYKWGVPVILPYGFSPHDGDIIKIGGQDFNVIGPLQGVGAFGQRITFWRFVNRNKFLYVDSGSDWKQYVHSGDITLEYDVYTRLQLKRNVLRRFYYEDELTQYSVQYIVYLTSSNAYSVQYLPKSGVTKSFTPDYQPSMVLPDIPDKLLKPVP